MQIHFFVLHNHMTRIAIANISAFAYSLFLDMKSGGNGIFLLTRPMDMDLPDGRGAPPSTMKSGNPDEATTLNLQFAKLCLVAAG